MNLYVTVSAVVVMKWSIVSVCLTVSYLANCIEATPAAVSTHNTLYSMPSMNELSFEEKLVKSIVVDLRFS